MVVLTALGYEEEVESGLSTMSMMLSNEAMALMDAVRTRLGAMSKDERAAYEAAMRTYFPVIHEGGSDRTQITLELRMKLETGYHLERYSFELRDGAWLLCKLETAGVNS